MGLAISKCGVCSTVLFCWEGTQDIAAFLLTKAGLGTVLYCGYSESDRLSTCVFCTVRARIVSGYNGECSSLLEGIAFLQLLCWCDSSV